MTHDDLGFGNRRTRPTTEDQPTWREHWETLGYPGPSRYGRGRRKVRQRTRQQDRHRHPEGA